jgi:hypothetical protein
VQAGRKAKRVHTISIKRWSSAAKIAPTYYLSVIDELRLLLLFARCDPSHQAILSEVDFRVNELMLYTEIYERLSAWDAKGGALSRYDLPLQ